MPIDEHHPQRPINAYGETKLAIERALPHFERATGIRWMALRYFNAAGADPDGRIGEDHDPEEHLIPRAIAAANGGAPLTLFGDDYPTPDGTCLRDYVHVADLADAHLAALRALAAGAASAAYNLGNGQGMSVREVIDSVAPDDRPRGAAHDRPAAARATRPGWWRRASPHGAPWAGRPRFPELDDIVRTAWRWHETHPRRLRHGRDMARLKGVLDRSAPVGRDAGLQRAGDDRGDHPPRVLGVPVRTELIVVDDGSTDGTRDMLTALKQAHASSWSSSRRTPARARRCGGASRTSRAIWSSSRTPTSSTRRRSIPT